MHRRVVVTGMGIVSNIGNDLATVTQSLHDSKSGIVFNPEYQEHGFRSQVAGLIRFDQDLEIDRKHVRFMGDAALYSYLSMQQAIADSGLRAEDVSHPRVGLIAGSGGASAANQIESASIVQKTGGTKRIGPYRVTRCMGNTVSACLSTFFGVKGVNYSISSACATSLHCIGAAYEQIKYGIQDMMFAGGGEEEHWSVSAMFDAMQALSSAYNDNPAVASRPYDKNRDGFVIAAGGGIIVLEELQHALDRGAPIYGELIGYSATSDGEDMVQPSGGGAINAMQAIVDTIDGPIDYINTHGTSTPVGDVAELRAIEKVFGNKSPYLSSTKALTGHSLGSTGVHEVIFCLLMLKHQFIAGSANIEELDPAASSSNIVQQSKDQALTQVMSNSFGFGGTNACVALRNYNS